MNWINERREEKKERMQTARFVSCLLAGMLLLSTFTVAHAQTLKKSVFGTAGGPVVTPTLTLNATGGQPAIGIVSQTNVTTKIGFWYKANLSPVLTSTSGDPLPDQTVDENETLALTFSATDPDGTVPTLTAENLPEFAQFDAPGDGTATLIFSPNFEQAGTYENITVTASDGVLFDSTVFTLAVNDVNRLPVADAGESQTLECVAHTGTPVQLDGSASNDLDDHALSFEWSAEGIAFDDANSVTPIGTFSVGTTEVTLTVTDELGGSAVAMVLITVEDTTPPELTVPVEPLIVEAQSPQGIAVTDEAVVAFLASATASDNCDVSPILVNNAPEAFIPLGETNVTWTTTDAAGLSVEGSQTVFVVDNTSPVITSLTDDFTIECSSFDGEAVTFAVQASDVVDTDLNIRWDLVEGSELVTLIGTEAELTHTFGLGTYTIRVTVTDDYDNSTEGVVLLTVEDTTAPVITLQGDNPLLLGLNEDYVESGASALDACDGDVSDRLTITGDVDPTVEGSYTVVYEAVDASGNVGQAIRTVNVSVSVSNYALLALNSMEINQKANLHSGFVGVNSYGEAPFLAGKVELVIGQQVWAAQGVQMSAPRVEVRQKAEIMGTLITSEPDIKKKADVQDLQVVGAGYWPLFETLPPFQEANPNTDDREVKKKESITLAPGVYGSVSVKQNATVIFTGGQYDLQSFDVGQQVDVIFQNATVLRIADKLVVDQKTTFGPALDAEITASNIEIFVGGINGNNGSLKANPPAVKIGQHATFKAQVYAPYGLIELNQKALAIGQFIAQDIKVGQHVDIYRSEPQASMATKIALSSDEPTGPEADELIFGAEQNWPNPFNPSTTIRYTIADVSDVQLIIYNVLGQQVLQLVNDIQAPGHYNVVWDGHDALGRQVATGVYVYRLIAGKNVAVKKMTFAK